MALSSVPIITIDGPSGSGKGTLASALGSVLGWTILDSGALYGEDISEDIRTEEVGFRASKIASNPKLRRGILDFQRSFISSPGLVADGRDMGTVVFPEAQLKIFLTASASVRGKRRFIQLKNKGLSVSLPDLIRQIKERDFQDENRQVAPLKAAQEAVILDSSENTIEEVLDLAMLEVRKRGLAA